uniref:Replication protein E1 n=1 Tax=Human papillomavirus TaxID=10566 RepID=A0A385PJW3_9PAPI|nr:MAG: E1 protein [Human papillomavirus]
MGDNIKGTENTDSLENLSDWCFITEAECVDSVDTLSELFDAETESDISNLIDDIEPGSQGNSLALFNEQVTEECNNAISELKRKFIASPDQSLEKLSPRLQAVHISPQRVSKRRLFEDSGLGDDETSNAVTQNASQVDISVPCSLEIDKSVTENLNILRSTNRKATLLCKFKEKYNVSFCELTRVFKSNKTCTPNWVIAVFAVAEEVIEVSKTTLQQYIDYLQVIPSDFAAVYLIEFKNTKNRDSVYNLFKNILNIPETHMLCDPPRIRSTAAALFFYRKAVAEIGFKVGDFPHWITSLTTLSHQQAAAETFKLSDMVQWAYDNDFTEESEIAFYYAQYAVENSNAAAFLESNQQVKYVKDCCQMVRLYKRQEKRNMSMGQWITKCCNDYEPGDKWKTIVKFLNFQGVNFLSFLISLKQVLQNIPKKSCMVIYGPPDTGKSHFCFSMIKLLQGKIISFMNKNSHFWLTPLLEGKIGLLDDATYPCWTYLDNYMRNAFDGNQVSVDVKHKTLQQTKLPPMLVTTNVAVPKEPTLMYLKSRLLCIEFAQKMPVNNRGEPLYNITTECWAMFFRKFYRQLELTDDDGDCTDPGRSFCCTTREANDSH